MTSDTGSEFASSLAGLNEKALSIVVVGASGHLAKTKTFPALFGLFQLNLIPPHTRIVGFARSAWSDEEFRSKSLGQLEGTEEEVAQFVAMCSYCAGAYGSAESFAELDAKLAVLEAENGGPESNRLFYFAIPPSVFSEAAASVKASCTSKTGWNRVVVEKPFGRDSESSAELSNTLLSHFSEDQLYRIDHYLGKELVQNLMILRFGNMIFEPLWNNKYIANVMITFKEKDGVVGRGGYFDHYGIIRDVMQNHLFQILSLVAMEPPVTMEAEDVRDEKVKVLRAIPPLEPKDVVIGQYTRSTDGTVPGYKEDSSVPDDSRTPTFALAMFKIANPRWDGVPFILKCGKALNERKAEVRIQFKQFPGQHLYGRELPVNELVMRVQPNEAIYMKMNTKSPGLSESPMQSELDLTYRKRFKDAQGTLPGAYERLILDVLRGNHSQFVRNDELEHAWNVFTPVLHEIDAGNVPVVEYEYGSRAPVSADARLRDIGVKRYTNYQWYEHSEFNTDTPS